MGEFSDVHRGGGVGTGNGEGRKAGVGDGADLESRAAYLEGLVRGLDLASASEQGRVLKEVVELLGALSREVVALRTQTSPGSQPDAVVPGAEPTRPDVPVFLAFECPRCGEDIFVEAEASESGSATRQPGLRLLDAPAGRKSLSPARPAREFRVTCGNCGEVFLVCDRSGRAPAARPLAATRRATPLVVPKRPTRKLGGPRD